MIWGARTAIEVVVLSLVFSITIGVPLGLISGYVGGKLDRGLVLINDALFAFPYLLLAIVIAFLLSDKIGQGIITAAIAITVVYVPAVLPRRPQPRDQHPRGVLRGGGAGARSAAPDDHSPLRALRT